MKPDWSPGHERAGTVAFDKQAAFPRVAAWQKATEQANMPALNYRIIVKEPIVVVLPSDLFCPRASAITLRGETFLGMSNAAHRFQAVIDDYLKRCGVDLRPAHRIDNCDGPFRGADGVVSLLVWSAHPAA
ncbi:MAG: hypothetical protein WB820_23440 [Rhodoplanes sp.]